MLYKISVIIPIYNGEKYLVECIDSIVCQTLDEIEIICIDDGSTDDTLNILRKYQEENSKIVIKSINHKGTGHARNVGIRVAKGKYICVMDSDDCYYDELSLEKLFRFAEKNQALICGGNMVDYYENNRLIDSVGNFTKKEELQTLLYPHIYGQTRYLYNREFLLKHKILYPNYRRFEDPPFLLNALITAEKYYVINEYVYKRRIHENTAKRTLELALDILNGILECLMIASGSPKVMLGESEISDAITDSITYFYPYIDNEEVLNLIFKINTLARNDKSICGFPFSDFNSFNQYIDNIKDIIDTVKKQDWIVLYGAGRAAERLIESGIVKKEQIFAVLSSYSQCENKFLDHKIEDVESYDFSLSGHLVLIAAGEKNSKKMEQNLKARNVNNYKILSTNMIKILQIELEGLKNAQSDSIKCKLERQDISNSTTSR